MKQNILVQLDPHSSTDGGPSTGEGEQEGEGPLGVGTARKRVAGNFKILLKVFRKILLKYLSWAAHPTNILNSIDPLGLGWKMTAPDHIYRV